MKKIFRKLLLQKLDEEQVIKIIASTCLQYHDSGETSVSREARVIMLALEENGFKIIKK